MRTIRVAVAGLGVVGRETVRLLRDNEERFARRLGAEIKVVAVCDRDAAKEARALRLPSDVLRLNDPSRLPTLKGVDLVVELLGGLDAPKRLALATLGAGRHLVTANKRLVAETWTALQKAAGKSGARLAFEGSVAGGIPILQALESGFAANEIQSVHGILNGTTNYILSAMERGASAQDALKEAQALGFAEKIPTMDVSGRDTAQKVSVLAALLTGAALPPSKIARQGIERIEADDVSFALDTLKRVPKLIGALKLHWSGRVRAEASVFPTLVPLDHPLASVRREYNAVLVKASHADDLMFYGKGAGAGPTASAVVGDIFMLSRDLLGGIPARRQASTTLDLVDEADAVSAFYLRLAAQDKPGVLASVTKALAERGISIATIHQSGKRRSGAQPVVLTTHPTRQGDLNAALKKILASKDVAPRHTSMRMLA